MPANCKNIIPPRKVLGLLPTCLLIFCTMALGAGKEQGSVGVLVEADGEPAWQMQLLKREGIRATRESLMQYLRQQQELLAQAIEHSGLLEQFPEIDLDNQKVGIFGKVTKLEAKVVEGSRIEIYRPITADPELVERRDQDDD